MTPIGFEWHEAVGEPLLAMATRSRSGVGAVRDGDAALQGRDAADDHEVIVTFRELARTRTLRRESYLSPPNGFSVVLSLNSAGRSISEARRFPSCCS